MSRMEIPKEAPKDAKDVLGKMMPKAKEMKAKGGKMKEKYTAKPLDLDKKVGKPRTELNSAQKRQFAEIIAQAKEAIKNDPQNNDRKVGHGDNMTFNVDGIDYVYLRDHTKRGSGRDRLFKKV